MYLTLNHHRFRNIQMTVDLGESSGIAVECSFSFDLNYNDEYSACETVMVFRVISKDHPEAFGITLEGIGQFSCEGIDSDDTKRVAHVRAYELLFPYYQGMIARLTVDAGLPPLMIAMEKMKESAVQIRQD